MKYIFFEVEDMIRKCGKDVFIKTQQVPAGKNANNEDTFLYAVLCVSYHNGNYYINTTPVIPLENMNEEDYFKLVNEKYIEQIEKIKKENPKIEVIKGGVEE